MEPVQKGKVYGVDIFNGDIHTGHRNTYDQVIQYVQYAKEKFGVDNIEIIKSDFNELVKTWDKQIDILHIDGLHTYEAVKNDFEKWSPFLSSKGVILFHDTESFPEVNKLFEEIEMPKFKFKNSAGLGVASNDLVFIQNLTYEFNCYGNSINIYADDISIGVINHDNKVYEKYLLPSISRILGNPDLHIVNSVNRPAKNYNNLIDKCDSKYLLLVHEDVTFGYDTLQIFKECINNNPNFGAIGIVGTDANGVYYWGEREKYKSVQKLDGCCILINTEHGIRFDEETFDDFHLYVEDYCMQAKQKGLDCIVADIHATEAAKEDEYEFASSYFKHHSNTVNKLGFCWGRYNEYYQKFLDKWDLIPTVDVVIVSYAKNEELKQTTQTCIDSLIKSESTIKFNIIVVESQHSVSYDGENITMVYPIEPFNYNKYLNIGCSHAKGKYICVCNNDLTFEKGWATNIIHAMTLYPNIDSASPFCPQMTPVSHKEWLVHYGKVVRQQLYGWCIFLKKETYQKIGKFDEDVMFWYSDNIYGDQLNFHNLNHALITSSEVNHHDKNLGKSATSLLDKDTTDEYTIKQNNLYSIARKKYNK